MTKDKKETFLLVSLNESKAKELAQVVSNNTCRKILDYLSNHDDATETQISEDLDIPISTVHYNLHQLIKGKLVEAEEFHYSKKGKEVNHYKLANKYIIIAPKTTTTSFKEKLAKIFPVAIFIILGAGLIQLISFFRMGLMSSTLDSSVSSMQLANEMIDPAIRNVAMDTAASVAQGATNVAEKAVSSGVSYAASASHSIISGAAIWFLIGGILAIIFYLLFEIIKEKVMNKSRS